MAVGALRAVREAGLRVPEDVAVAARMDNPVWAGLVEPPLTALAQPVRAMAEAAVRLVLEQVAGERREAVRVVLPMELRIGRTRPGRRSRPPTEALEHRHDPGSERPEHADGIDGTDGARGRAR